MNHRLPSLLALALAAALGLAAGGADPPPAQFEDFEVQARYLSLFVNYVEWTAAPNAVNDAALVIGVIGDSKLGDFLKELVEQEAKVKSRKVVVHQYAAGETPHECQIVFIGKSENQRLGPLLRDLAATGTLTVGEAEQFTRLGGVVRFFRDGKRIRLEINVDAAKCQGLTISGQLLQTARVVALGCGRPGK